jgi:hypothetical protein
MRVAYDPATGRLVPPSRQRLRDAETNADRSASTFEPYVVRHADGSATGYLGERYMSHVVARIDGSGRIHVTCVDGPRSTSKSHRAVPAPPPAAEK